MKLRRKRATVALLTAALGVSGEGAVAAAEAEPVTYVGKSNWNVNYADDSCRLGRLFSDGTNDIILVLDQFEPGPTMHGTVAGAPFRGLGRRKVTIRFGPGGSEVTIPELIEATFGKYGPSVMTGPITLVGQAMEPEEGLAPAILLPPSAEQERGIIWLEVTRGGRAPVRLALDPMDKTMDAMRRCTDELLTHWGIDAQAHRSLTRRVQPASNPGRWVSGNDYPREMIAKGVQGLIQFRLSIDENGNVSDCHIQQSTRPVEFDEQVCRIMSKRARFIPALDATGRPIKSYWRSSFRFMIE